MRPGDLPDLPPVTGVKLTVRGDTALVDFDATAGALDYRCAGDMPLVRVAD